MKLEEVLYTGHPFKRPEHSRWLRVGDPKGQYECIRLHEPQKDDRGTPDLSPTDILADDWMIKPPDKIIENIYEFADKHGLTLTASYLGKSHCIASFDDVHVLQENYGSRTPIENFDEKKRYDTRYTFGMGPSIEAAIADYASQIQGEWIMRKASYDRNCLKTKVDLFTTDKAAIAEYLLETDPRLRRLGEERHKQLEKEND